MKTDIQVQNSEAWIKVTFLFKRVQSTMLRDMDCSQALHTANCWNSLNWPATAAHSKWRICQDCHSNRHGKTNKTHSNDPIPFLPKDTIENLYSMEQDDGIYFKNTVDLVVAKNTCSSAEDLLHNFDLEICSCSFDGVKFKIPSPHSVFKNKSNPSVHFFFSKDFLEMPSSLSHQPLQGADLIVSKVSSFPSLEITPKPQQHWT